MKKNVIGIVLCMMIFVSGCEKNKDSFINNNDDFENSVENNSQNLPENDKNEDEQQNPSDNNTTDKNKEPENNVKDEINKENTVKPSGKYLTCSLPVENDDIYTLKQVKRIRFVNEKAIDMEIIETYEIKSKHIDVADIFIDTIISFYKSENEKGNDVSYTRKGLTIVATTKYDMKKLDNYDPKMTYEDYKAERINEGYSCN